MSLTTRVLLGLIAGLVLGVIIAATRHPLAITLAQFVEPLGTLWLNALRMTVIPLVFSLLVTAVVSATEAAAAGRLAARTVALVLLFLCGAALFGAVATSVILTLWPVEATTAAALRAGLVTDAGPAATIPSFAEWVTTIVPSNAIEAAANGAILPLVVFALIFGLATSRLGPEPRDRLLGLFRALREVMMIIVQWVLRLAPIGVFALVLPFAIGGGVRSVGVLAHYVALNAGLSVLIILSLYPAAAVGGRLSVRRFARGVAPAQAVALSTRSSLASLPAMLEGAQARLGVSPMVAGLALPLAVTLMRVTTVTANLVMVSFAAALYGIDVSGPQIAAGIAVTVLMSLASVGLPGEVGLMAVAIPIFQVTGVPLGPLALFLAVEMIPDMIGTVGNVTADMALTSMVARKSAAHVEPVAQLPISA